MARHNIPPQNLPQVFREIAGLLVPRFQSCLQRIAIDLVAHIKQNKLSGQVLRNRTGTLRRSITHRVSVDGKKVVAVVGTNVKYAAIHEYGFDGPEQVRSHMRTITEAFGRPLKNPVRVQVSQFTRHMKMPERSFLRSAVADKKDEIMKELQSFLEDMTNEVAERLSK